VIKGLLSGFLIQHFFAAPSRSSEYVSFFPRFFFPIPPRLTVAHPIRGSRRLPLLLQVRYRRPAFPSTLQNFFAPLISNGTSAISLSTPEELFPTSRSTTGCMTWIPVQDIINDVSGRCEGRSLLSPRRQCPLSGVFELLFTLHGDQLFYLHLLRPPKSHFPRRSNSGIPRRSIWETPSSPLRLFLLQGHHLT